MSKQLILGNWKMNKTISDIFAYCASFKTILKNKKNVELLKKVDAGIAPTYVGLIPFKSTIDARISLIAQNVSDELSGARTGQIAVSMLKDLQTKYCLIGHSEVRQYLHETNQAINKKVQILLNNDIIPVLCIGESLVEFENNKTKQVLQTQIKECLANIDNNKIANVVIAYEPI
jgi:triosephosphate isomerase